MAYRTSQLRILLLPFALGLSACQTMDDVPVSNTWESVPPTRISAGPLTATQVAVTAAAAAAVIVTGLSGGNLGQMLRAGLIAGATAFAFDLVGDLTPGAAHAMGSPQFDPAAYAENVAGHALVGCGTSVASGGLADRARFLVRSPLALAVDQRSAL